MPRGARDGQADHVGLRGAADEEPARVGGVARGLGAPPDDLLLDEDGGVVGAAEVGVDDARHEVGQVARPGAPAPMYQPQKRGWSLPIEYGTTRSRTSR